MLRPNARPMRSPTKSPTPCARSSSTMQAETAKLISKGTPVARTNTGIDGGMNQVFAAALPEGNTGLSEGGDGQACRCCMARAPGTIPSHVNPPRALRHLLIGAPEAPKLAAVPAPAPAAAPAPTRVAMRRRAAENDGCFSSLARKVGLGGAADTTASTPPRSRRYRGQAQRAAASGSLPRRRPTAPKPDTKQAASRPPLKPSVSDTPGRPPRRTLVAGSRRSCRRIRSTAASRR